MNRAYELGQDLSHRRGNEDYDIWHVYNDLNETFHNWFIKRNIPVNRLPPHRFEGKIKRLQKYDYPWCNQPYPIMSMKMIEVLEDVGEFKHTVFPIDIYKPGTDNKLDVRFALLDLPEPFYFVDFEKSTYKGSLGVKQPALIEPEGGYPPLFRLYIKGVTAYTYVSAAAKEALEAADIKGVRFIELIDS